MKNKKAQKKKIFLIIFFVFLVMLFVSISYTLCSIFNSYSIQPTQDITKVIKQIRLDRSDISFVYPSNFVPQQEVTHGTGYSQEFLDSQKTFQLTLEKRGNYNQITGKPYTRVLDLYGQKDIARVRDIDGQEGIITSTKPTINTVTVFSKNKQDIYILELQSQDLKDKTNKTLYNTFNQMIASISLSSEDGKLGAINEAEVLVQDASTYGPPFDPNLYQLEVDPSKHFFAKSNSLNLKTYIGKKVHLTYRHVIGVVMGEQQLVMIESIQ